MAYKNNRLRFNKLLMNDVDLILIDMDPSDPLDFYLEHYKEQLAAGYTKTTLDSGLRVYIKDYNKLQPASLRATTKGSEVAALSLPDRGKPCRFERERALRFGISCKSPSPLMRRVLMPSSGDE